MDLTNLSGIEMNDAIFGRTKPSVDKKGLIHYPKSYNPIIEYWELIENKKVIVPKKIKKTYKKIILDLSKKNTEYYFDNERSNHVIEFAENYCRHSKGKMGGKRVVLEIWEKATLSTIFGFIDINGNTELNVIDTK